MVGRRCICHPVLTVSDNNSIFSVATCFEARGKEKLKVQEALMSYLGAEGHLFSAQELNTDENPMLTLYSTVWNPLTVARIFL